VYSVASDAVVVQGRNIRMVKSMSMGKKVIAESQLVFTSWLEMRGEEIMTRLRYSVLS
jgi:hypothetical protein